MSILRKDDDLNPGSKRKVPMLGKGDDLNLDSRRRAEREIIWTLVSKDGIVYSEPLFAVDLRL